MKFLKKFETEDDVVTDVTPMVYLVNATKTIGYVQGKLPVQIQHIDGTLYSLDEWINNKFSNDQANGVAILSDSESILIAKVHQRCEWGDHILVSNLSEDFGTGFENTNIIVNTLGDNGGVMYAAKAAKSYTFPDGTTGFLPSKKEVSIIIPVLKLVNSYLGFLGGDLIESPNSSWDYIWTSSKGDYISDGKYYSIAYSFDSREWTNLHRDGIGHAVVIKYLSN